MSIFHLLAMTGFGALAAFLAFSEPRRQRIGDPAGAGALDDGRHVEPGARSVATRPDGWLAGAHQLRVVGRRLELVLRRVSFARYFATLGALAAFTAFGASHEAICDTTWGLGIAAMFGAVVFSVSLYKNTIETTLALDAESVRVRRGGLWARPGGEVAVPTPGVLRLEPAPTEDREAWRLLVRTHENCLVPLDVRIGDVESACYLSERFNGWLEELRAPKAYRV